MLNTPYGRSTFFGIAILILSSSAGGISWWRGWNLPQRLSLASAGGAVFVTLVSGAILLSKVIKDQDCLAEIGPLPMIGIAVPAACIAWGIFQKAPIGGHPGDGRLLNIQAAVAGAEFKLTCPC